MDLVERALADLPALEADERVALVVARLAVLADVDARDAAARGAADGLLEERAQVVLLDLLRHVGHAQRGQVLARRAAAGTGVARVGRGLAGAACAAHRPEHGEAKGEGGQELAGAGSREGRARAHGGTYLPLVEGAAASAGVGSAPKSGVAVIPHPRRGQPVVR